MTALATVVGYVVLGLWALLGLVGLMLVAGSRKRKKRCVGEETDRPGSAALVDQHETVGGMGEPRAPLRRPVSPDARGETVAPSPTHMLAPNGDGMMRYYTVEEITR